MYQSDISSDLTSQLLSIKEIIKNKNLYSTQTLTSFILENDFSTSYSDILGAYIIYEDTFGTIINKVQQLVIESLTYIISNINNINIL